MMWVLKQLQVSRISRGEFIERYNLLGSGGQGVERIIVCRYGACLRQAIIYFLVDVISLPHRHAGARGNLPGSDGERSHLRNRPCLASPLADS